ncbi:MAG: autotransporter domain-containing protein [Pseudolabrys sp.]|nr:autotransporter domain-containing protein [Pseudolabrys sp.]
MAFTKGLTARGRLLRTTLLGTTALVALGLVLAPSPSRSDTNWTGANSTDWFDPGNWSGGVPTNATDAFFDMVTPNPAEVDGPAAQAGEIYVGIIGTGTLTIQNGGAVSSNSGIIGFSTTAAGTVTVDGAGSSWVNTGQLAVALAGTGVLNIQNGGIVSNGSSVIGGLGGSTGTVTVDGTGSSWTNAGALSVGYPGTGTLTIQNGGAVSNSSGNIGYFAGSTGTVTVDGTGSSWTNVSDLAVGNSGTGTLMIQNGGAVSNAIGFVGSNAGSTGTVTVDGAGSTWTNATVVIGYSGNGTLTIQNGGRVSSNGGLVGFETNTTGTVTVDGAGSSWTTNQLIIANLGIGLLTIQNGGAVTNSNGYVGGAAGSTGAVTVDGTSSSWTNTGALHVGEAGTGALTIRNGGTVSAFGAYVGFGAGSIGTATVADAGSSWTATDNFIFGYSGTGTLTVQNGATVSASGTSIVGYDAGSTGTVTVDGAGSSWTNTGQIRVGHSGSGTLTIQNDGAVSAANVWIGPFNGSTGTLNIGSASGQAAVAPGTLNTASVAFGAGTGRVVFNHTAANYAFNPIISGAGTVRVEAGTTSLTANNTYTGATTVDGGTLAVNGSIASSVLTTVNTGGALGGTGTVGATTIASGGTLAPGNSIGTLSVNGALTFNAGSTYAVEVSRTAADRTNVTGTATLSGATVNAVALPGSFRGQTYTILNATGGLGGTQFAGLTGSSFAPGARNPHLTYDANNVFLVLDAGTIQLPGGIGGNQSGVAGGINNAVENGGTPPAGFDVLLDVTGAQLTNALGQVSGQPGASTAQTSLAATGQFINGVLDSAVGDGEGQGGALGYAQAPKISREAKDAYAAVTPRDRIATFDARWNVWASVYGGNSRVAGDATAGTSTTTSRTFGTAAGASYRFTPDTQAGFALGGAGANFSLDGGFGSGKADIFNAALYARHTIGAAYVAGLLGYSWQDTTTDRNVLGEQLHASFKAQALSGRLEGGWRFATPSLGITPYAALQTTTFYLPAYGETATSSPGIFALNYEPKTITATRGELGAKFDKAMLVKGGTVTLKAKAAWAHDWNTDRAATAVFQALPGSTFTVNGAQPSANAALLSLGAEMTWHNGWSFAGSVDGEFSRTTASYAGKGRVRYAW